MLGVHFPWGISGLVSASKQFFESAVHE
jgi:hypothetical protein